MLYIRLWSCEQTWPMTYSTHCCFCICATRPNSTAVHVAKTVRLHLQCTPLLTPVWICRTFTTHVIPYAYVMWWLYVSSVRWWFHITGNLSNVICKWSYRAAQLERYADATMRVVQNIHVGDSYDALEDIRQESEFMEQVSDTLEYLCQYTTQDPLLPWNMCSLPCCSKSHKPTIGFQC